MHKEELTKDDFALIEAAKALFDQNMKKDWHGVASAIRLHSGKIETAFVLEAEVSSLTVCAEPIVIGKVLTHLNTDPIDCIVAVRRNESTDHKVIPPCGRCREFITDYDETGEARVIVYDAYANDLFKMKACDLLPFKYSKSAHS
jgi:cytidine deaminase